jgi:hypothetical protein
MTEHLHPRDPRARRRAFDPVDALEAAVRLDVAADAMRAAQHTRGPEVDDVPDWAADHLSGGGVLAADVVTAVQLGTVEPPLTAQEFADALGRPPGHPEYCAEGCIHLDDDGAGVSVAESPEPAPVPVPPTPAPVTLEHLADGDALDRSIGRAVERAVERAAFIPEQGRRLDWRSRHDPRSLSYGVRARLEASAPIVDHVWPVGPVLDQGAEGACVGFAVADASNVLERAGLVPPDGKLCDADDAGRLYRFAQTVDEVPGEDYTGTSVLAGMQAGVEAGLFGGYLWAFGTRDIAQAVLQRGPVVIGIPWLSGMYETGPGGLVVVEGEEVGGHCLAVVGIRQKGPQGQPGPYFIWLNSWGPDYGAGGLGYVHHRDLAGLLHGRGEAAIPTATPLTPAA